MNPAIIRNSVVLPQPDGPSIEKKLPRSTLKDSASTAVCPAKRLLTWRASRSGAAVDAAVGAAVPLDVVAISSPP